MLSLHQWEASQFDGFVNGAEGCLNATGLDLLSSAKSTSWAHQAKMCREKVVLIVLFHEGMDWHWLEGAGSSAVLMFAHFVGQWHDHRLMSSLTDMHIHAQSLQLGAGRVSSKHSVVIWNEHAVQWESHVLKTDCKRPRHKVSHDLSFLVHARLWVGMHGMISFVVPTFKEFALLTLPLLLAILLPMLPLGAVTPDGDMHMGQVGKLF